jgi:hypothetical protein
MTGVLVLIGIMSLLGARPACAQSSSLRALGGFLSIGGYFLTSSSADRALGANKFYTETAFFVRPKKYGWLWLSGGVEFYGGSDHFLPFSGGNFFQFYGGAVRLSTPRAMNRLRGILTAGLYIGRIRSERLDFDVARFSPALYLGTEYPFARYFTLSAGYRVSQDVQGVNLDGFSIALKLF